MMKKVFLAFCFVLLSVGMANAQVSFTITGRLGSTAQVTLTAPVVTVVQAVVDAANKHNGCDMIAKTCPRGGAFQTIASYLTDRIDEVFRSYESQVLEGQKVAACGTWKTLSMIDRQPIIDKLGGDPCGGN